MSNQSWDKSSTLQNSENSFGGLFLFHETFNMISGSQKSHHPFTRHEIWSLYIGYLNGEKKNGYQFCILWNYFHYSLILTYIRSSANWDNRALICSAIVKIIMYSVHWQRKFKAEYKKIPCITWVLVIAKWLMDIRVGEDILEFRRVFACILAWRN
jgi:hypothetical protein